MSEEELAEVVEPVYNKFLTGELKPKGKDLCDMSGATNRTPDEFTVFNAMLPRTYYPEWQVRGGTRTCRTQMHLLPQAPAGRKLAPVPPLTTRNLCNPNLPALNSSDVCSVSA